MIRAAALLLLLCTLSVAAQMAPDDARIIPGLPPDEYVDVTGDGIADLLITGRTVNVKDPQQPGLNGWYMLGVRTLQGTSVLRWSTPSTQRWYTVEDSTPLDTGLLAQRIHFRQLTWTGEDDPTEFWLLERPFGPAITKDQDGWYGTGDHHDGLTLVLRSASARGTSVAAFAFDLPYPYGRVAIAVKRVVPVPNGFGEEGDPVPIRSKVMDEPDFGHEDNAPQVMVPQGVPPDEPIDLTSDDIADVVIVGENAPHHASGPPLGTYHRGVRMKPGSALLMERNPDGRYTTVALSEGRSLSPEQLNEGLRMDRYRWAEPTRWPLFIHVLQQRYGSLRTPDEPAGWLPAREAVQENFVFSSTQYGRPVVGCFEINHTTPGGEIGVRVLGLAEDGQLLQID